MLAGPYCGPYMLAAGPAVVPVYLLLALLCDPCMLAGPCCGPCMLAAGPCVGLALL